MHHLRARTTARVLAGAGLMLLTLSAPAQVPGDYNGDGYVDGDDFWYWAGCMTGPGASFSDPNCAAFDFDLLRAPDGKVDLADFAVWGRGFTGRPCTVGRKYTHVSKADSATGSSANIRTRTPTLCGWPSAQSTALSGAWAGVIKSDGQQVVGWGQSGYIRYRVQGSSTVYFLYYAETKSGPNPQTDYDIHLSLDPPGEGVHEYKCYLISSLFGTWIYEYDGLEWYRYTHSGWRYQTGTHNQWAGEIFNKEDQMVGTAAAKCEFTGCQYAASWGMFQSASIGAGDLHTDDPNEWGIELTSSTSFNVWDKKP